VPDHAETYARLRTGLGPELDAFVNETRCKYPGLEMHPTAVRLGQRERPPACSDAPIIDGCYTNPQMTA